jgi:hypothetical protein
MPDMRAKGESARTASIKGWVPMRSTEMPAWAMGGMQMATDTSESAMAETLLTAFSSTY